MNTGGIFSTALRGLNAIVEHHEKSGRIAEALVPVWELGTVVARLYTFDATAATTRKMVTRVEGELAGTQRRNSAIKWSWKHVWMMIRICFMLP